MFKQQEQLFVSWGKPITKQRFSHWRLDAIEIVCTSSSFTDGLGCALNPQAVLQPHGPCLRESSHSISVLQLTAHCLSHLQAFTV